jgi:hypothetical protein
MAVVVVAYGLLLSGLGQACVEAGVHEENEVGVVGYGGRYDRVVVLELVPGHDAVVLAGRVERVQKALQCL